MMEIGREKRTDVRCFGGVRRGPGEEHRHWEEEEEGRRKCRELHDPMMIASPFLASRANLRVITLKILN